jgi:hypothetical protein
MNGSAAHRQKRQGDPRLKLGERATQDLEGPLEIAEWLRGIGTHSEYDKINVREVKDEKSQTD